MLSFGKRSFAVAVSSDWLGFGDENEYFSHAVVYRFGLLTGFPLLCVAYCAY